MIELFPLQLEYCEAVADIAKLCLPESWSYQSVCDVLHYSNNIYYVAKDMEEDKVIGFAGIMIVADEAELLNIAILDGYRNKGIAKRLLLLLFEQAKAAKAYRMLLEVRERNLTAISLYEKLEFQQIGKRKNYYSNPKDDALIMEHMLD